MVLGFHGRGGGGGGSSLQPHLKAFLAQEKQALDAMSSPKGSYSFGCTSEDMKILV